MLGFLLSGGMIPTLLMICGVFFLIYLRGLPLLSPKALFRAMRARAPRAETEGTGKEVSPFRAVMLALAGTLGVGNIVGVANAVWIGGAGAVFWMWVSALLAMLLKYAEIVLAVRHRRVREDGTHYGGAICYIRDDFAARGKWRTGAILSALFAVLMILNALSMGCVIQVNAVSMAARGVWGIPTWLSGLVLAALVLPILLRGTHGVAALTELLVPIMTAGYLILSIAVLIIKRDALGEAFSSIFKSAFDLQSATGGIVGFLTSKALRVGTMRGLLSNEAGCGTAPTAHAAADAHSPAAQGVWGIFEVFVDTILLCTVTALVILVSFSEVEMLGGDAVMMTIRAYSCVLGEWSAWFFGAAILCFGYATVLCWANYGLESLQAIRKGSGWHYLYLASFLVCLLVGAVVAPESVWGVADFAIAALTSINLWMLLRMRREVKQETALFMRGKGRK